MLRSNINRKLTALDLRIRNNKKIQKLLQKSKSLKTKVRDGGLHCKDLKIFKVIN